MKTELKCYINGVDTITFNKETVRNTATGMVEVIINTRDVECPENSEERSVVISVDDLLDIAKHLKED